ARLEAGREVVRRVQPRRVRRVRHARERGYHQCTAAYQVGGRVGVGQPAAHEQRPGDVGGGEAVRRVDGEVDALHRETREGTAREVVYQIVAGLDLVRRAVERQHDVRWRWCRHGVILPGEGTQGEDPARGRALALPGPGEAPDLQLETLSERCTPSTRVTHASAVQSPLAGGARLNGGMQNLLSDTPPVLLPGDPAAESALAEASRGAEPDAAGLKAVAARFPTYSAAWASLADLALA